MKKNFRNWTKTELYKLLGVRLGKDCKYLNDWIKLGNEQELSTFEEQYFNWLFKHKTPFIDDWNEAELRDQFISNITSIINYNSSEYLIGVFAERSLSTEINGISINGKVDWMVATGSDLPLQPYFFIHVPIAIGNKQEDGNNTVSGRAQLYAIMRVAQELNENKDEPIYGCYVLGRFWFFTSLVGNYYCITKAYDATEMEELIQIVKILKAQKEIIIKRVTKERIS